MAFDDLTNDIGSPADQRPLMGGVRLRRLEASRYLKVKHGVTVSVATLAAFACRGGGPVYETFGRYPMYLPDELDKWVADRLGKRRKNTSES